MAFNRFSFSNGVVQKKITIYNKGNIKTTLNLKQFETENRQTPT